MVHTLFQKKTYVGVTVFIYVGSHIKASEKVYFIQKKTVSEKNALVNKSFRNIKKARDQT